MLSFRKLTTLAVSLYMTSLPTVVQAQSDNIIVQACVDKNFFVTGECRLFNGFEPESCVNLSSPLFKAMSSFEVVNAAKSCKFYRNPGCSDAVFLVSNQKVIGDLGVFGWDDAIASFSCSLNPST